MSSFRSLSTALAVGHPDDKWERDFLEATATIQSDVTHEQSAASMRLLVRSGLLRHTDLRDHPERFFKAHRLLARHAVEQGPGFWIRFTVHYNLCFGTVLAVGGPEQIAALDAVQDAGQLGCFALTEKLAGVQSGLVVETQASYDAKAQEFVLHTPSEGAAKNWISQGFTADKAVVLAELTVGGKNVGPHAFLMDLRRRGELVAGVSVGDMGIKSTGNDLDNAWIRFDQVRLPRTALLNAHADVDDQGGYARRTADIAPFEMIGQRLYTGRVAVAQAALAYRSQLFDVTRAYADAKPVPAPRAHPRGAPPPRLSGIPQLRHLFAEADERAAKVEAFVTRCEERLTPLLRTGALPGAQLTQAIATAKVKAVETSIDLCWRLKQEVGSYALMGSSGFVHLDFLNCCKFAEGDSRVLMQKMARDRLRQFGQDRKAGVTPPASHEAEVELCSRLGAAMAVAKGNKALELELWDENWMTVYALAEATMARTMREFMDA
jgi:acyl-CoA oxidase